MSDTDTPAKVSPHLLPSLTAPFWAGHWIVARGVHLEVTPVSLAFWRWMTAIALLVPLAGRQLARDWPVVRAHWKAIALFGLTGNALYNTVGYYGIRETTATNALLIQSVTPALIPLFAFALFGERIGARAALGVAVSFCGVLAIVSRLDPTLLASLQINHGDLFLLGNVAMWALYTVCLRFKPPALSQLSFLLACSLASMLVMLPLYAADLAAGGRIVPGWSQKPRVRSPKTSSNKPPYRWMFAMMVTFPGAFFPNRILARRRRQPLTHVKPGRTIDGHNLRNCQNRFDSSLAAR